ncbi:hypothetical protein DSL92_06595 [Billgrantia gudaonensis]|uniref:Uncharacterized protein n=1 Tax=Billgrantia gudaonensis TaxID=376427 RepID=A0A432JIX6_9GAMM|nr:hypothetical protein DSL92_06595 [Halomonas gudaonensis]
MRTETEKALVEPSPLPTSVSARLPGTGNATPELASAMSVWLDTALWGRSVPLPCHARGQRSVLLALARLVEHLGEG